MTVGYLFVGSSNAKSVWISAKRLKSKSQHNKTEHKYFTTHAHARYAAHNQQK